MAGAIWPLDTMSSIQDRTPEFRSILAQAQKRLLVNKTGARISTPIHNNSSSVSARPPRKSDFARKAAEIGTGIAATVGKLERLAKLAQRKTLFDDRPIEINQLTFVIKQDLAGLNQQIGQLSGILKQARQAAGKAGDQEGTNNENIVTLLQGRLADVGLSFKDVLEVRTKNIQASRSRQDNFVSSVSTATAGQNLPLLGAPGARSDSPLYNSASGRSSSSQPRRQDDLLSLEPPTNGSSALARGSGSEQQMMLLEQGQGDTAYIQQRGEAIETIERTINELGGIFGQLAQMVSEQGDMIQRIDANTEDVVDNVQGAQRELMKYWNRVQGNRMLVAKMFGVLMICKLARCVIGQMTDTAQSFYSGSSSRGNHMMQHGTASECRFIECIMTYHPNDHSDLPCLPRQQLVRFHVLVMRRLHDLRCHADSLLPLESFFHQPVPDRLLVETRLRAASLVRGLGPEPRAVRREHLIDQHDLIRLLVESKLKLCVCDDDAFLSRVVPCL